MLIVPPIAFRGRRGLLTAPALKLVSATYASLASVTLKFNQPIDISQAQGAEIEVNDVPNNTLLVGAEEPATRVDPFTVRIDLEAAGPSTGGVGATLSATDDTRIRTIPDAKEWAGVSELPIPYP